MSSTRLRDEASRLAPTDRAAALETARRISEPLFRCQALAAVARWAGTDAEAKRLAREAYESATEARDPFVPAIGAAWPVRAVLERGLAAEADLLLGRAFASANEIAHPVCRVDALFVLVQAAWAAPTERWHSAVSALVASARTARSWKPASVLRDLVVMLAAAGRDYRAVLAALPEGQVRRACLRDLAAQRPAHPRPFFWG